MVDLSQPPAGGRGNGYEQLYRLWKDNYDAFAEGRDVGGPEYAEWLDQVRSHLDPRELRFFNGAFEARIQNIPEWVQAKTGGRLYKILMDRHGYKVARDRGGLG